MGSDSLVARMHVVGGLTVPELNGFGVDRYLPDIPKVWFKLTYLPISIFSNVGMKGFRNARLYKCIAL